MNDSPDALATLRHELRTPINHIMGYGEMVAEELADLGREDLVADLGKVRMAAKRLLELIDLNLREDGVLGGGVAALPRVVTSPELEAQDGDLEGRAPRAAQDGDLEGRGPLDAGASGEGHLLVVDDDEGNRRILSRRLTREGYSVVEAADGEEALSILREQEFDVVLLDVMMPKVDGSTALLRMKEDEALRHIPVIMISALDEIGSVVRCIEGGAEDYLPKPFNPTLLRARLGASLEKKRFRDQERTYLRTIEETQARLSDELHEAANYVRSIIPAPMSEPFKIDWSYEPSGELGGDAFGYHWIDDEHFAIYLLDVCGHGVGAALLSVTAINVIRSGSLASTDFRKPGEVLGALNNAFLMENQNNMYFTIWYGVVHAPTKRMRYASGGHPPSLLLRADGGAEQIRTRGMMIGAMEGMKFEDAEVELRTGDRLIVLCDGTYEVTRADGTMIDFEDFEAAMIERAADPAGLEGLLAWVHELRAGQPLQDDFSIVRVEF